MPILAPRALCATLLALAACSNPSQPDASDGGLADAEPFADASAPDAALPSICAGHCELDILPRVAHLPLTSSGEQPSLALVGVRDTGPDALPELVYGQAEWRSLDPSIASVDAEGRITAIKRGSTLIELSYQGLLAYAELSVSGNVSDRALGPGPLARDYRLFVPDSYQGDAMPLVFSFHGGFGTGANQMDMSQMNRAAAEHGFLVAYPNGLGVIPTWNGGNCCGSAAENGVDDVGFVREVLADIAADLAVDSQRVYATGFSNGAILSHRLGCQASDIFAAIAPVSGGLNLGGDFLSCAPPRPVPTLIIHGATDRNYPLEGGVGIGNSGADFYPIASTVSDWVAINEADPNKSTATFQSDGALCVEYRRAGSGDSDVQSCLIFPLTVPTADDQVVYDGGGHAFPGGARGPADTSDLPSTFLDGAEHIWQFFAEHPMPQ